LAQLTTLGMMAGLVLTGTLSGVYLGNSAVNEINPAHFRGPAIHPRDRGVAVDPNQYVERSAFAGAIWYRDKPRVDGLDCLECDVFRLSLRSAGVKPDAHVDEALTASFADPSGGGHDFTEAAATIAGPADDAYREALAQVARYAHATYDPSKSERTGSSPGLLSPTAVSTGFTE
jgi:hypothetical protein